MSESITAADDKDALKALKASLNILKKRPMNCAVGDVDKRTEILLHPAKSPTSLLIELRQAHKEAKKVSSGIACLSPSNKEEVVLDLKAKPAAGICRRLARRFRGTGLRIVSLKVDGQEIERFDGADDDASEPAVAADAAVDAETDLEATKDRIRTLAARIRKFPLDDPNGAQARTMFGTIMDQLRDRNIPSAATLQQLADLIGKLPEPEVTAGPSNAAGPARPAAAQPSQLGVTPLEKFSATLRHAGDDLKAARALPGNPDLADDSAALETLLKRLTAARAAQDFAGAGALSQQAWGTALRMLGKANQTKGQAAIHDRMGPVLEKVKKTYFTDVSIDAMKELHPGRTFQRLIDAQERFRDEPTAGGCEAIEAAAQAYLAHFAKLPKVQTVSKEMKLKKAQADAAITGARHMKLALQYDELGTPPWNAGQEIQAAAIEATFAFETGTLIDMSRRHKTQGTSNDIKASMLGGASGASAAFWVKGFDPGKSAGNKDADDTLLLFKPSAGEPDMWGHPTGSSAPREAMAHALTHSIRGMTGLDLDCPRTQLVTVSADKIDVGGYNKKLHELRQQPGGAAKYATTPDLDPNAGAFTGSVQHFAASDGPLSDQEDLDLSTIPAGDCHRIALLDILTLNVDRHSGNLLVQKNGPAGTPRLIPIDHGLTFPTKDALEQRAPDRMNNATHGNALLKMPNSFQPLPESMCQRIDMLDPAAIEAEMQRARQALNEQHPRAGMDDKLPDDVIERTKRSARLLKLASRQLSPAVIQIMIAAEWEELFGAAEDTFEDVALQKIASYAEQADAITSLYLAPGKKLEDICQHLKSEKKVDYDHNRPMSMEKFRQWLARNAGEAWELISKQPMDGGGESHEASS